jgi:hypothetical protein
MDGLFASSWFYNFLSVLNQTFDAQREGFTGHPAPFFSVFPAVMQPGKSGKLTPKSESESLCK